MTLGTLGRSRPNVGEVPHIFLFSFRSTVGGRREQPGDMNKDLETVVEREVDALGYDVVLLRQGGTRSRPVLELRIDRRDGERVSIGDCVRVSRAVEARLDAESGEAAPFGGRRYELQVSSPGEMRRRREVSTTDVRVPGTQRDASSGAADARQPEESTKQSDGSQDTPAGVHTDDGSRNGRFD